MKLVKGIGPMDAKIAFIGEAPGAEEERAGIPFVGSAGKLFSELLRSAGIMREYCYVTNVVKERPPRNDIGKFIRFGKGGHAIETPAYKEYVMMLKDELDQLSANVLVPLGNVPLYALTGHTAVTKRAGSVFESSLLPGRKVIPTIHPSAALRMFLWRYDIVHDLMRIKEESEFPEIRHPEREMVIKPSFAETIEFLGELAEQPIIAVDIEVSAGEVSCIALSISPAKIISIPFVIHNEYFPIEQEREVWKRIARILEDPTQTHVGQNMSFDAWFLYLRYGIRVSNIEDTMVAQKIVNPDFPMGLDYITRIYTKEPYYKDEGKKSGGFMGGGNRQFWLYNARDAAVTHEAYAQLIADVRLSRNEGAYRRSTDIIPALVFMQTRGVLVDVAAMRKEADAYNVRCDELRAELAEAAGSPVNPGSPKQLQQLFYVQLGHKPYFKNGTPTTNDDALKRLIRKGCKEAEIVKEFRKVDKIRGTYLEMQFDDDNRMRSSFNPAGTRTGRLSSSKNIFGTGGNFQNIPHSVRKYFLADPGYVMYEVDLSQAENRIVAYVSGDPRMIDAFETGKDVHSLTAGLIFDKPPEEVSRADGSSSLGNGEQSERFWGKKSNHSFNYGLGYKAFALSMEMPEREAKYLIERYHAVYPNIRNRYHNWVQECLSKDRSITNLRGRRQIFRERWGYELFKDAYAFLPQSTVADIINEFGILEVWNNQNLYGPLELMNQVHDSIMFQIPLSVPWGGHKRMLLALKQALEVELDFHGTKWRIPADFQIGLNMGPFDKDNPKVNPTGLRPIDPNDPEAGYAKISGLG